MPQGDKRTVWYLDQISVRLDFVLAVGSEHKQELAHAAVRTTLALNNTTQAAARQVTSIVS